MNRTKAKKIILAVMILSLCVYLGYYGYLQYFGEEEALSIGYQEFLNRVEAQQIEVVYLADHPQLTGRLMTGEAFVTDNPRTEALKEQLLLQGVRVVENNQDYSSGQILMMVGLVGALVLGAFLLSKYHAKSTSKEYDKMSAIESATERVQGIGFQHIAGNEEAKNNLLELVDFLKTPEKYAYYGARMPKGVILYGPPGTGKTLMAKALAHEAGVDFLAVSGSDFVQIYVGVGAARIRSLFKQAAEKQKCVIFIDEIDAIGKKRDRGGLGGSDESDRTLNALLTEMSGFKGNEGIVVVAATNRLDILDEALLRPGRFDRQIEVALPDWKARKEILSLYTKNKPISQEIDLGALAYQTVYFSGAKLENLINEAAIYAAREEAACITEQHLDQAFYKVVAGEEKKDRSNVTLLDRRITAYHEAGHAAVTKLLCPENRVTKVTIIPSTTGVGGFSMNIPPDRMYHTKKSMLNNIQVALGGRIVESLIFGEDCITTGASNDIQKATETLFAMVSRFGMSEKMGMLNYEVLCGNRGIDAELRQELAQKMEQLYEATKKLLLQHMPLVEEIAEKLIAQDTLSEREIDGIFDTYQTENLPAVN